MMKPLKKIAQARASAATTYPAIRIGLPVLLPGPTFFVDCSARRDTSAWSTSRGAPLSGWDVIRAP